MAKSFFDTEDTDFFRQQATAAANPFAMWEEPEPAYLPRPAQLPQSSLREAPSEFSKGMDLGWKGLEAGTYGAGANLAAMVGATELEKTLAAEQQQLNQEIANRPQPRVARVEDVKSLRDAWDYAAQGLGQLVPSALTMIGGGMVGKLGFGGAAGLLTRSAPAMRTGAAVGNVLGAGLASQLPQLGDIYEENPETPWLNYGASLAQAGLDVYPYLRATKLLGKLPKEVVEKSIKPLGTELLKQAGIEGGTEALQAVIAQAVSAYNDPAKSMWSEEAKSEYLNNFVLGALGGAVIGGGVDVAGRALGKILPVPAEQPPPEQPPPAPTLRDAAQQPPADMDIPDWRMDRLDQGPWQPPVQQDFPRAEVLDPVLAPEQPGLSSRPQTPQRPSLMQELQSEARGNAGYSDPQIAEMFKKAYQSEQLAAAYRGMANAPPVETGAMAESLHSIKQIDYAERAVKAEQEAAQLRDQANAMLRRGEVKASPLSRMVQQSARRDEDDAPDGNQGFDVRRVGYGAEYDFPTQTVLSVDRNGNPAELTVDEERTRLYKLKVDATNKLNGATDKRTKAYREAKAELASIDAKMRLLHDEKEYPTPHFDKDSAEQQRASIEAANPNNDVETVPYWDYVQSRFEKEGYDRVTRDKYAQDIMRRLEANPRAPKRAEGETAQQYLSRVWTTRTTSSDMLGRVSEESLTNKQLWRDENARGETVLTRKPRNIQAIRTRRSGIVTKNNAGQEIGIDFPRLIEMQKRRWANRLDDIPSESERTAFYFAEGLASIAERAGLTNLDALLSALPDDTVVAPKAKSGEKGPDLMWGELKTLPGMLSRAKGRTQALTARLAQVEGETPARIAQRDSILREHGGLDALLSKIDKQAAKFKSIAGTMKEKAKKLTSFQTNLDLAKTSGRPTEALQRVVDAITKELNAIRIDFYRAREELLALDIAHKAVKLGNSAERNESDNIKKADAQLRGALMALTEAEAQEAARVKQEKNEGAFVPDDDKDRIKRGVNPETGAPQVIYSDAAPSQEVSLIDRNVEEQKKVAKQDWTELPAKFVARAKVLLDKLREQETNKGVKRDLETLGFPYNFLMKPFNKEEGAKRWVLGEEVETAGGKIITYVQRENAIAFLDALVNKRVKLPPQINEALDKANPQDVAPATPTPVTVRAPQTSAEEWAEAIGKQKGTVEAAKRSLAELIAAQINKADADKIANRDARVTIMRAALKREEARLAQLEKEAQNVALTAPAETPESPAPSTIVQGTYTGGAPTIHSGGATGADTMFSNEANKLGFGVQAHSFEGHNAHKGTNDTLIRHTPEELAQANELLKTVNKERLHRSFPATNERTNDLLRRNYFQVKDADAVVAIGHIKNGVVDGGTAWAVYMGVELGKPTFVFDMQTNEWTQITKQANLAGRKPPLFQNFAGVGSRHDGMTVKGAQALREYMAQYPKVAAPAARSTAVNVYWGAGENKELSNLAPRKFEFEGRAYLSVEQAYQSLKSGTFEPRVYNSYVPSGGAGKHLSGSSTKQDSNWNLDLMKRLMKASFEQNPQAAQRLLATGDAPITHRQDRGIWNREFPRILMEVRSELRPADSMSPDEGGLTAPLNIATADRIGKGLSHDESGRICNGTCGALVKRLKDAGLPYAAVWINAKSPLASATRSISHYVAVTEINGRRYVLDQPQSEFLKPSAARWQGVMPWMDNQNFSAFSGLDYLNHAEITSADLFSSVDPTTGKAEIDGTEYATFKNVRQIENPRPEFGDETGAWWAAESLDGKYEYRWPESDPDQAEALPRGDDATVAYSSETMQPRLIEATPEALAAAYGMSNEPLSKSVREPKTKLQAKLRSTSELSQAVKDINEAELTRPKPADSMSPDEGSADFRASFSERLKVKTEQWKAKTKNRGENKALRDLAGKLSKLFGLGEIVIMSPQEVVDEYARLAEAKIGNPTAELAQLFNPGSTRYGRYFGISPDGKMRVWVDPARTKSQRVVTLIHEIGHGVFRTYFDRMSPQIRDAMRAEWEKHVEILRADPTNGNWARMQTPANFDQLVDAIAQEQLKPEFMPYATDFEEWVVNRVVQWVGKNEAPRSLVDQVFKGIADFLSRLYAFAKEGKFGVSKTVDAFIEDVIAKHGDATVLRQQTVSASPPAFANVMARQAAFIERALEKLGGLRAQPGQGGGHDGARVIRAMDDFADPQLTGRSAEAVIEALKTLLRPAEWALLGRAARTPAMLNQIRRAFEGHDHVLAQLDNIQRKPDKSVKYDPVDYAVAYMFMLRAAGVIEVGPQTLRTFKAFNGKMQNLWKRMSGMRSSAEQLQTLLEGLTNHGIIDRANGGTWELPPHLRQKALHRAMQRVYSVAKSFRDNVYAKFMRTAQERLMATNNPYLQYIAQMFHATSYGAAQSGSYFERIGAKFGEVDRRLREVLGDYMEDDEFLADLSAALRNPDVMALAIPEVKRVAKDLTDKVFTPLYHYMKGVGLDVEFRENYYPWFVDMLETGRAGETAVMTFFLQRHYLPYWQELTDKYNLRLPQMLKREWTQASKDKDLFIVNGRLNADAWQDHLHELAKEEAARNPLTPPDTMRRVYQQWTSQINIEIITDEKELLHNPKMSFINARELNFLQTAGTAADREFLANLFQKDLRITLAQYIMNAVKRTEFARIAGPNGEWLYDQYEKVVPDNPMKDSRLRGASGERKITGLLDEARRSGASERDIMLAKAYVNAMAGMGGIDTKKQLDAMIEWSPLPKRWKKSMQEGIVINPRLQRAFGWVTVFQNYRLLGLSPLSSLIDPLGIAVRSNDMVLAIRGMKEAMKAMSDKAAGDPNHLMWMAELIGVLDRHLLSDAVMQTYMGPSQYQTPLQAKLNDALFRGNMMIALTRFSRLAALAAGKSFLKRHTVDPTQHSLRYMEELGLRPGDVRIDESGELEVLSDAQRNQATPEEYERDERVRLALYRFVDQSIIRPDPAQRTLWMSDPHLQLVGYLRSFMYSFYERILKRVATEAIDHGNVGPLLIMTMSYLPLMIMADLLRDLIQNGGEAPWKKAWGVSDYVSYGAKRAGFMGKYEGLAHDWEAQGGPTVEQLYDLFASRPALEQDLIRALPLNNIYRNWFKQPKVKEEYGYGKELDQGSDQAAWSAT